MSGQTGGCEDQEFLYFFEQLPVGLIIVDPNDIVLLANKFGARLLKMKAKHLVGSIFSHPIENGTMRDFDVELTVKDLTWQKTSCRLLHLESLKSSGAFHLEWKLESTMERARKAEEKLGELLLNDVAKGDKESHRSELTRLEERLTIAQSALQDSEKRYSEASANQAATSKEAGLLEGRLRETLALLSAVEAQSAQKEKEFKEELKAFKASLVKAAKRQQDTERISATWVQKAEEELQKARKSLEEKKTSFLVEIQTAKSEAQKSAQRLLYAKKEYELLKTESESDLSDKSQALEFSQTRLREALNKLENLAAEHKRLSKKVCSDTKLSDERIADLQSELQSTREEREALFIELEEAAQIREDYKTREIESGRQLQALEESTVRNEELKKAVNRLKTRLDSSQELVERGAKFEKVERKLEGALRRAEDAEERLREERRLLVELKLKLDSLSIKGEEKHSISELGVARVTEKPAFQDNLTGLASRDVIHRHLGFMLKQSARYKRFTVMLRIDCDGFTVINETHGRELGDLLLRNVGERLSSIVRSSDALGRLQDDEFVVLLSELSDKDEASIMTSAVLTRIHKRFNEPFQIGELSINLGVSLGISFYPTDAKNCEEMFNNSQIALQRAKSAGPSQFQYFAEDLHSAQAARSILNSELRKGYQNKQFTLLFQPIVDLSQGKVVGAESLLRWHHPKHGVLEPKDFLRVAEDSGMMVLIGQWVLRQALEQALIWKENGVDIFVSVNLSRSQLRQTDFFPAVQSLLEEFKFSPDRLLLEIPESLNDKELPTVRGNLVQLKQIGVRLAVDNFGTATSSLQGLRQGPFQVIKIDRSFVLGLPQQEESTGIVLSSLTLSHHLNKIAIAVGVETESEKNWLTKTGCRFAQGNILSQPVASPQLIEFTRKR